MIRRATASELLKLKKVTFDSIARVIRVSVRTEEKRLRAENFKSVSEQVNTLRETASVVRGRLMSAEEIMEFLKRNDTEIQAKAIRAKSRNALNAKLTTLKEEAAVELHDLSTALTDGSIRVALETAMRNGDVEPVESE